MALTLTLYSGRPRKKRGQGAIEAILALPVFLILICLIFQLFFLGIAQIQLQYAAFYAARCGAVTNADEVEMKRTVKRILAGSPGLRSIPDRSFEVEILNTWREKGKYLDTTPETRNKPLMVCVHWHYPLIVPFADKLIQVKSAFIFQGKPSIHLKASWATAMFEQIPGD